MPGALRNLGIRIDRLRAVFAFWRNLVFPQRADIADAHYKVRICQDDSKSIASFPN
jgi:hypothetical protein